MADQPSSLDSTPPATATTDASVKAQSEAFLAEMEQRRKEQEAAVAPEYDFSALPTSVAQRPVLVRAEFLNEKGIIGFLLRKGIVSNKNQANLVLLGVAIVAIAFAVWLMWPSSPKTPPVVALPAVPPATSPVVQ